MSTSPGWYHDPGGQGQRYHDGEQWTTAKRSSEPPPQQARFTIHYGFALIAALSLIVTLFVGIGMISSDSADNPYDDWSTNFGIGWLLWGGMWTIIWAAFAVQHTLRGRQR